MDGPLDGFYTRRFGELPEIRAMAPGRINLIGEHIDYLGGTVMPIAIDRHIIIEAIANDSGRVEIATDPPFGTELATIDLADLTARESPYEQWLNYLIGVLALYRRRGFPIPGLRIAITADLPSGAGLSASAALETAMALVIEASAGKSLSVVDRALLCQAAEHEFAGVPCGVMDQMAVGAGMAGHAMQLDCADLDLRQVKMADELAVIVADTGVKHALADGEYEKRRADCEAIQSRLGVEDLTALSRGEVEAADEILGELLQRRARHVVSEMERVASFSQALESRDDAALGSIMQASHDSLRDDYEVSCPELDFLVEAAYDAAGPRGIIGSRMTGGGFGGSTVTLVRKESSDEVKKYFDRVYEEKFGQAPNCFITLAVDGARVVYS